MDSESLCLEWNAHLMSFCKMLYADQKEHYLLGLVNSSTLPTSNSLKIYKLVALKLSVGLDSDAAHIHSYSPYFWPYYENFSFHLPQAHNTPQTFYWNIKYTLPKIFCFDLFFSFAWKRIKKWDQEPHLEHSWAKQQDFREIIF